MALSGRFIQTFKALWFSVDIVSLISYYVLLNSMVSSCVRESCLGLVIEEVVYGNLSFSNTYKFKEV